MPRPTTATSRPALAGGAAAPAPRDVPPNAVLCPRDAAPRSPRTAGFITIASVGLVAPARGLSSRFRVEGRRRENPGETGGSCAARRSRWSSTSAPVSLAKTAMFAGACAGFKGRACRPRSPAAVTTSRASAGGVLNCCKLYLGLIPANLSGHPRLQCQQSANRPWDIAQVPDRRGPGTCSCRLRRHRTHHASVPAALPKHLSGQASHRHVCRIVRLVRLSSRSANHKRQLGHLRQSLGGRRPRIAAAPAAEGANRAALSTPPLPLTALCAAVPLRGGGTIEVSAVMFVTDSRGPGAVVPSKSKSICPPGQGNPCSAL